MRKWVFCNCCCKLFNTQHSMCLNTNDLLLLFFNHYVFHSKNKTHKIVNEYQFENFHKRWCGQVCWKHVLVCEMYMYMKENLKLEVVTRHWSCMCGIYTQRCVFMWVSAGNFMHFHDYECIKSHWNWLTPIAATRGKHLWRVCIELGFFLFVWHKHCAIICMIKKLVKFVCLYNDLRMDSAATEQLTSTHHGVCVTFLS